MAGKWIKDVEALADRLPSGTMGASTFDTDADIERDLVLKGPGNLKLHLAGSLRARALNGPEDIDEDGVAGSSAAPRQGTNLSPQLELGASGPCWLQYRASAAPKAGGKATFAPVGFSFEGGAEAILLDYRAHARSQSVRAALLEDAAAGPRTAFSLPDVLGLGVGDAVAVRLRGNLKVALTLNWSDVLTTHLGIALAQMQASGGLALKLQLGAKVTAFASQTDDFVVVFARSGADAWTVALRKARTRRRGGGATVGLTVEVPEAEVQPYVDAFVESLLGAPLAKLDSALANAGDLGAADKALLSRAASLFGLGDPEKNVSRLREIVKTVPQKAKAALVEAAKKKIEASFAYEYVRLDSSTVLLEAVLSKATLEKHHHDLLWGQVPRGVSGGDDGVEVKRFIHEAARSKTSSWGFSLNLGKWTLSGSDDKAFSCVDRLDADGAVLERAYLGARSYEGRWVSKRWSWTVDFAAATRQPLERPPVTVGDLACGLGIVWTQSGKLNPEGVEEMLDTAVLWRIVAPQQRSTFEDALTPFLGTTFKATTQVLHGPGAFWRIRPLLAARGSNAASIAGALAEAMPWWKHRPWTPEERRRVFEPLWARYLKEPGSDRDSLLALLPPEPKLRELSSLEEVLDAKGGSRPWTFVGLVELNDTARCFDKFTQGMYSLERATVDREPDHGRVAKIFGDLAAFFAQAHHVRALGAYMLEASASCNNLGAVKRSLTVEFDNDKTLMFAAPTE